MTQPQDFKKSSRPTLKRNTIMGVAAALALIFYGVAQQSPNSAQAMESEIESSTRSAATAQTETFIYSGGCFWCTEADSEKLEGVKEVISGFTGGTTKDPKYYSGKWGDHREGAKVFYDPNVISFEELVQHVYQTVDYEDADGQFCDRGHSYSPAIYVKNEEQAAIAKALAPASSVLPIEQESAFYPVREAHQDFYKKRAVKYKFYRYSCGRDQRIDALMKKAGN